MVTVVVGDDLESCRAPVKMMLALYIGGMGARGKNFYNDYAKRLGYEKEADTIQDLYLEGKKGEAIAMVPDRAGRRGGARGAFRAHPRAGASLEAVPGVDDDSRHRSARSGPPARGAVPLRGASEGDAPGAKHSREP